MTQWEQWNITPLPISADDAWKEMEKLLEEDSSNNIPLLFVSSLDIDRRKKKRLIIWLFIALCILFISGLWMYKNNKSPFILLSHPTKNINRIHSSNNKTSSNTPNFSKKIVNETKKTVGESKNNVRLPYSESVSGKLNSELIKSTSPLIPHKQQKENDSNEKEKTELVYPLNKANKTNLELSKEPAKTEMENTKASTSRGFRDVSKPFAKRRVGKELGYRKTKKIITIKNDNKSKSTAFNSTTTGQEIIPQIKPQQKILPKNELLSKTGNTATESLKQGNLRRSKDLNVNKINEMTTLDMDSSTNSLVKNPVLLLDTTNSKVQRHSLFSLDTSKAGLLIDTNKVKDGGNIARKKSNKLRLTAGLQWIASLPMTDNNSNTEKQLIPGIWLAKAIGNKSSISVSFNPFVMHTNTKIIIEDKILSISKLADDLKLDSSWFYYDPVLGGQVLDTSKRVNRIATLLQSFGYRFVFDYKYQILKRWQLSAGIEYNTIVTAYLNDKIIRVNDNLIAKDATSAYTSDSDLWNLLQHSYFSGNAALSFSPVTIFSIAVGFHKPFNSITNNNNQVISPTSYFLNFRWRFWKSKH